jgi:DNA-binding response OmpR family regulator
MNWIPLAKQTGMSIASQNAPMLWHMPTPHLGAAPRILVADDDDLLSAVVSSSLELQGYDVSSSPQGRIPLTAPLEFDLVILDAHIPGEDFATTLAYLHTQPVAVLVLSGEVSPPPGIPPDNYLGKPVELEELLGTVARLISQSTGVDPA